MRDEKLHAFLSLLQKRFFRDQLFSQKGGGRKKREFSFFWKAEEEFSRAVDTRRGVTG